MQRKLLTNGNVFKRTDGRWGGVVWYMDEQGERKRKSFSGTTKQEANKKITAYIAEFENQVELSDESKKLLKDSIQNWLEIFKFPTVEQTTYDRCECTAINQVYPILDPNELKKFKEEAYATYSNGERKHRQAAAYILMLNTGARPGEILAVNNRDIDIEKRQMKIQNSMKEVYNREGTKATGGKSAKVGRKRH